MLGLLTGEPEYLDPLGEEAPEGWIVTGYPWDAIDTPEHNAFVKAYQAKYDDYPRLGSLVGYNTILSIAAAIEKAGSTETEAIVDAFKGHQHEDRKTVMVGKSDSVRLDIGGRRKNKKKKKKK